MKRRMTWVDDRWRQYLRDDDGNLVCSLIKQDKPDVWRMYAPRIGAEDFTIYAKNVEEAKWRATLTVYDECNRIANYYHEIRDHLPDVHELAKRMNERR